MKYAILVTNHETDEQTLLYETLAERLFKTVVFDTEQEAQTYAVESQDYNQFVTFTVIPYDDAAKAKYHSDIDDI